jgi:hypothetical protein
MVCDEQVVSDDLAGSITATDLGPIPAAAAVDAYHLLKNGDHLLSVEETVVLPGGVLAFPGDLVRFDGASYAIELEALVAGVPPAADTDAVSLFLGLVPLLSFDVTVDLGGLTVHDEDVVMFGEPVPSLLFDGSAAGIDGGLDVDALHYIDCNGHLLLSFDGSGTAGAVVFDDEDVLEWDPSGGSFELIYDGSAEHGGWPAGDLDALAATVDLGPGPPATFGETIFAGDKTSFTWANPVDYRAVRGAFVASQDIAGYPFDAAVASSGTNLVDPALPPLTSGLWYLLKHGGCVQTSWQTTLGAEPARDVALP